MARDELDGRLHGPGAEDAEVRGGAGRAGEDDDEAWGRPAWGRRGGTAGWGRRGGAATVERRPGTDARPGKNAAAHAGERARGGKKKSGRRATSI